MNNPDQPNSVLSVALSEAYYAQFRSGLVRMKVIVLGAGVVGVTTAYYLAASGHDVTVVERCDEPAAGTSHANGGQLSYSFTDALARPSFLKAIPGLLLGRDPAVRVTLRSKPPLIGWGLRFLMQCTPSRARANTLHVLQLAMRSASLLAAIRERTGVQFAFRQSGKLVLLPAGANLMAVSRTIGLKKEHGCHTDLLPIAEACELEPAIERFRGRYASALYSADDEVGDAHQFTAALCDWLAREAGVRFRYGETAVSLSLQSGRVVGVRTDKGSLAADRVVVCLGAWSPPVLRTAGVPTRIYPVRGYSLTLPAGADSPSISITDLQRRLLFCPLNGDMRISGFADFSGFDGQNDPARIALLASVAREIAPTAADYGSRQDVWAGSRPMTPDGRPLSGPTNVPGLYMNCGHGMLGWTLACATASDVAAAVEQS
ncbi:MAG: FAD-dependent oxidoreductase [Woeseiaceae bacterium]|nr:FAD-dependent oxidoreductase [Woeseiaceae bacterium]